MHLAVVRTLHIETLAVLEPARPAPGFLAGRIAFIAGVGIKLLPVRRQLDFHRVLVVRPHQVKVMLLGKDHISAVRRISRPTVGVLVLFFLDRIPLHQLAGVHVVIEIDLVHNELQRLAVLLEFHVLQRQRLLLVRLVGDFRQFLHHIGIVEKQPFFLLGRVHKIPLRPFSGLVTEPETVAILQKMRRDTQAAHFQTCLSELLCLLKIRFLTHGNTPDAAQAQ